PFAMLWGGVQGIAYSAVALVTPGTYADVDKAAATGMFFLPASADLNASANAFSVYLKGFFSKGAGAADDVASQGFDTFNQLKRYLGSPGENNQWHHIVEQSQIGKSGFTTQQIQNTNNIVAIEKSVHAKISGYYNSIQEFTGGLKVRDWLAGQDFQAQYDFGIEILKMFGIGE
ncbi:MAG: hypothetical protein JXL97_19440, partial [Bacteroidales bacterium]|nr:hypothetical protein [Bacteroidales bacterium]